MRLLPKKMSVKWRQFRSKLKNPISKKMVVRTGWVIVVFIGLSVVVLIPLPDQILTGIMWCMIISCVGYWVRHLVDFLFTDQG